MTKISYVSIVSVLFLIIGAVHIIRIINGWDASIGGYAVPMFASWIAAVVSLYLSFQGFQLKKGI